MRRLLVLGLVLGTAGPAVAQTALYNFSAPVFNFGETTPMLNRVPNVGPGSFATDFTSSGAASSFNIDNDPLPNILFAGQFITEPPSLTNVLNFSFSAPVYSFRVDFALNDAVAGGHLFFNSPVGPATQTANFIGGPFPGGTLTFNSATPFSTATLSGATSVGSLTQFAVDNLQVSLSAVPEPSSIVLTGVTGLLVGGWAWRRRR